jgi:hypothetical protein
MGRGFASGLHCQATSEGDWPFASSPFAHPIPQSRRRASEDLFSASLVSSFSQKLMHLSPGIPILRIFSEEKAKEFYLDFMGFSLEWEHRFGDNFPLYAQIKRSDLILHLSEHHGDATPGSAIFVPMQEIDVFQAELHAKSYRFAKPGIEAMPWGQIMEITDPFGNRMRFCEQSK